MIPLLIILFSVISPLHVLGTPSDVPLSAQYLTLHSPITFTEHNTVLFKGKINGISRLTINESDVSRHLPYFYYRVTIPSPNIQYRLDIEGYDGSQLIYSDSRSIVTIRLNDSPPIDASLLQQDAHTVSLLPFKTSIIRAYRNKGWSFNSLHSFKHSVNNALRSSHDMDRLHLNQLVDSAFSLEYSNQLLFFYPVLKSYDDIFSLTSQLQYFASSLLIPNPSNTFSKFSVVWYNRNLDFLEFKIKDSKSFIYFNNEKITRASFKRNISRSFFSAPIVL